MDKKYTIKDIAELAGVSKGTVDRVLHSRGKVSDNAQKKVDKILKEIDYQANPIARNLKNNKVYKICVLLPDPKEDAYWAPAVQGIKDATKEFKPFGLQVTKFYYKVLNPNSFLEKSREALHSKPDVLLIAPLFQKEALQVFKECNQQNVMVALFNNYIDTFNAEKFIGQDLFQSGRVAASLIDKLVDEIDATAIIHLDEEAHMKHKEDGFKAYFKERKNTSEITTISLKTTSNDGFKKSVTDFLKLNSKIRAVFITNSKAYLLVKVVEQLGKEITVVGYDLLDENINYLKKGKIDFLIHQKPKRQAYLGVGHLAEHFLFGKPIPEKNLLPIDIITKENVMYYSN
ncbi:MAG: substrate-binding domain-containing protein [Maribacter sp.]